MNYSTSWHCCWNWGADRYYLYCGHLQLLIYLRLWAGDNALIANSQRFSHSFPTAVKPLPHNATITPICYSDKIMLLWHCWQLLISDNITACATKILPIVSPSLMRLLDEKRRWHRRCAFRQYHDYFISPAATIFHACWISSHDMIRKWLLNSRYCHAMWPRVIRATIAYFSHHASAW